MPEGNFAPQAIEAMLAYSWPGNIRELGHIVERAMFMRTSDTITALDLNIPTSNSAKYSDESSQSDTDNIQSNNTASLDELEKEIIQSRLKMFDNNPQKTADSLGLSRSAYYRRLEKYQLIDSSKP
jgi:DNA-binding NtrC family response regulator